FFSKRVLNAPSSSSRWARDKSVGLAFFALVTDMVVASVSYRLVHRAPYMFSLLVSAFLLTRFGAIYRHLPGPRKPASTGPRLYGKRQPGCCFEKTRCHLCTNFPISCSSRRDRGISAWL